MRDQYSVCHIFNKKYKNNIDKILHWKIELSIIFMLLQTVSVQLWDDISRSTDVFRSSQRFMSFQSANIFIILWYSLDKIKSQGPSHVCAEGKNQYYVLQMILNLLWLNTKRLSRLLKKNWLSSIDKIQYYRYSMFNFVFLYANVIAISLICFMSVMLAFQK